MKKISLALIVILLAGFCAFAGGQQSGGSEAAFSGDYAFGGSTTLEGFIRPAAEEFMEKYGNPGI